EGLYLGDNLITWTTDFTAPYVRHDAEGANFVASLHDGDERLCALDLCSALRIFHVAWITVKRDFHRALAQRSNLFHHIRKLLNVLGAENKIQMGNFFE